MTARCALYKWIEWRNEPLWRYGHSKLSKMAACRQLGFVVTGNSAIRSADPENPTLEPNMKCITVSDHPLRRYDHSRILWAYGSPIWWEGEVVGGQRWHHSKERWWFSIGSRSIVTVALSVSALILMNEWQAFVDSWMDRYLDARRIHSNNRWTSNIVTWNQTPMIDTRFNTILICLNF